MPSPHGIACAAAPRLPGWTLRRAEHDLVLESPKGEAERFTLADDADSEQAAWLDLAQGSGCCLLIVGESLGLDHPDLDRIDALLADSRAVAAIISTDIAVDIAPRCTATSKPARNAPCPCGSGAKYKKCCAATSRPPSSPDTIEQVAADLTYHG